MTEETIDERNVQQQGRPWKEEAAFNTFKQADELRNEINDDKKKRYEAKVRCLGTSLNPVFIVKKRETLQYLAEIAFKKAKSPEKTERKTRKGENHQRKQKRNKR